MFARDLRNFYALFAGAACASVLLVVLANILVDPYDVFETRFLPYYGQPNERYLKIEHIRERAPETVLLGSSRTGTMRPRDFQDRLGGGRYFNLSVAQANQWDNLQHVKWLIAQLPSLRRLIIQVDWPDSYGPVKPGFPLISRMHPDIGGESKLKFLTTYATSFSPSALRSKIERYWKPEARVGYDMAEGYWEQMLPGCAGLTIMESAPPSEQLRRSIDRNIEALQEISRIASEHHVDLLLFVTPHSASQLDSLNLDDYLYFLKRLAEIRPYTNFGYYSPFTTDGCNYYELSHYRGDAARRIMDRIAGRDSSDEIGASVSAASVDRELQRVRANFADFRRRRNTQ